MKLLFTTQALDLDDPVLSAYHGWVAEAAKHHERVEAICLFKGRHELPENVGVHSLGKEKTTGGRVKAVGMIVYAARFLALAWKLRREYDAVFVHMNQEYVLIAGMLWKILGKRIYMWRNHYAGSALTDIAVFLSTKVFCTSRFSYTARYRKAVLMPVGVDTERFRPDMSVPRREGSILFFSRMAPSKNPLLLLEALRELRDHGIPYTATFAGSPPPEHEAYYRSLMGRAEHYRLSDRVSFVPGVPHDAAADLYRRHEIFVNCSPSGMLDKMIFEASASGCFVLASSVDFREQAGEAFFFEGTHQLREKLEAYRKYSPDERTGLMEKLQGVVRANTLYATMEKVTREIA